jgi:dipeptidase
VIVALLAEYGQGGSPRHNDPSAAAYDNSFILADPREAWVLETSGRDWVAKQATGVYSISNAPTLGRDFDLASQAIRDRPDVDFARDLGDWEGHPSESGTTRCGRSRLLLSNARGRIDVPAMMRFLSDHGPEAEIPGGWAPGGSGPATICVHPGGGQTAASLVAHLRPNGGPITAWCSLVTPCLSVFLPFYPDSNVPAALAHGGAEFDPASPWWRIKRLVEHASANWQERYPALRSYWQGWQQALLEQEPAMANAPAPERSTWVTRNVETLLRRLGEAEKRLDG